MAAFSANITIDRGTNYQSEFTLLNSDGSVVNLTGYTIEAKVKKNPTATTAVGFSATSVIPTSGQIILSMDAFTTNQLKSGRNYFDVILISPDGTITKALEGMVFVKETISV